MSPPHVLARSLLAVRPTRPVTSLVARAAASPQPSVSLMAPQRRKQGTTPVPAGYTEDWSKGAMLRFEDSLPRLPVPELSETAAKYLKSVHPLLSKEEFAKTKAAVDDFVKPGGRGEELQKRLVARRDDPKHKNWIYEWWNSAAYLCRERRGPLGESCR